MASDLDIEDEAQLRPWLAAQGHIARGEPVRVSVLAGGVSNRTVLVERASGEAWVLKQALAKLRVPGDWFSSPERVHREALGLRWLAELAPGATPRLVFEDAAAHLLAMGAVPQPHRNWKQELLRGRVVEGYVRQAARLLAAIHREAWCRRDELAPLFADRSFFESLRLEPYYAHTADQAPGAAPFLRALIGRTRACRLTLVHGDYSPKNMLLHRRRLVLLDHEVMHWGDPAFDVGFFLTHLLSKAHHLHDCRDSLLAMAAIFWRMYRSNLDNVPWRDALEPRAIRHTVACLLARVAGRSPLEYLAPNERERQRVGVLRLLRELPATLEQLGPQFLACLQFSN